MWIRRNFRTSKPEELVKLDRLIYFLKENKISYTFSVMGDKNNPKGYVYRLRWDGE